MLIDFINIQYVLEEVGTQLAPINIRKFTRGQSHTKSRQWHSSGQCRHSTYVVDIHTENILKMTKKKWEAIWYKSQNCARSVRGLGSGSESKEFTDHVCQEIILTPD